MYSSYIRGANTSYIWWVSNISKLSDNLICWLNTFIVFFSKHAGPRTSKGKIQNRQNPRQPQPVSAVPATTIALDCRVPDVGVPINYWVILLNKSFG
jgi:hypothetical protein